MSDDNGQTLRIGGVLGWTIACLGVWVLWLSVTLRQPIDPEVGPEVHATAVGMVATCGGCAVGSVWLVVLVIAAVVWALVRR